MNKYILAILFLFLKISLAISQSKYDYTWLFSTDLYGTRIDFNNKGKIDTILTNCMIPHNNCQISDKNGKLQFYFTGCRVFNSSAQVMDGGDSINYGKTWKSYCKNVGFNLYPGYHSSMIVPDPGNDANGRNGYYLIHKKIGTGICAISA